MYALDLRERFAGQRLDDTGFKEFLDMLPPEAAPERAKLELLFANPDAAVEADLSTRAGQLVWDAGLGYVFQNTSPNAVRSSPIWRALTRNPQLSSSLGTAARYVDLSLTNRNATMDWGMPGSGFWYSPDINHVNLDLFLTLLSGFSDDPAPGIQGPAHSIGTMLHEVGHSQLTTRFTDAMIALKEREARLVEENKSRKLTRDEFKELARVRTEFNLRHQIHNAAEDNCVDRYAVNQGRDLPYNIARSMNVSAVNSSLGLMLKNGTNTANPSLLDSPRKKEIAEAQERFSKLGLALALAFYTTNGLFDASDTATWKRFGIDPSTIKGTDGSSFDDLIEQCVGPNGVANLQPAFRDRWLLSSVFASGVETYAERRCKLIEDIWDKYAAPYAKALIDAAGDAAENDMNQQQAGNQGAPSQPDPQQNAGNGDNQNKDGQSGNQGQQSQSQQGEGRGDDSDKNGQPGNQGQQGSGSGSVDVEGVGKMGGVSLPSTPEDARKQARRNSEQGIKSEGSKTVRDLARDARQQERKNGTSGKSGKEASPESARDEASNPLEMNHGGQAGARDVDLAKLSGGDWREFKKRVNELEPVIARISDDFSYIRDRQKQLVHELSGENEELPRGDKMRQRLDMRAHMNLAAKRATGQKIEQSDLRRWRKDEVRAEPTSVELWILGDGSGSTRHPLSDGGRRIDSCLQTMAILYEAGKRADFDVYAGVWENHGVRMLAEPGMAENKIGENFDAVKRSGGVGTIYNTPIPGIIERLAKQSTDSEGRPKRFAGMTHFLWVVDGTQNDLDVEGTAAMLSKLFRYGPAVSIDIAYMGGYDNCETKEIVALVKKAVPGAQIDTLEAMNAKDAPILLARKIKNRFEQSASPVKAVPDQAKRECFFNAYRAMRTAHL